MKPVILDDDAAFEDVLAKSKRFTLRGCEEEGTITIPKTLFNFMYNISGYCTDSTEKTLFNNRKAMLEALDLFYKILDEQLHFKMSDIEYAKSFDADTSVNSKETEIKK